MLLFNNYRRMDKASKHALFEALNNETLRTFLLSAFQELDSQQSNLEIPETYDHASLAQFVSQFRVYQQQKMAIKDLLDIEQDYKQSLSDG